MADLKPPSGEQPRESEVAAATEYVRAMVSAVPEATVFVVGRDRSVWIADGVMIGRNRGRSARDLAGRSLDDVIPASRVQYLEYFEAALGGSTERFEYLTSDARSAAWIQLSPMYLGREQPVAVLAVIQDLTGRLRITAELEAAERARMESEALFKQGFEASPIGMALVSPRERRFLRVNDALCHMLRRSREELLGSLCADVTHPDDAAADELARQAMLASERSDWQCEKRYLRPDGSIVWGSLHVTPVYSREGDIRVFFAQIVDLTAHKEREFQLVREAADHERLLEVRQALSAGRLVLHAQPIVELSSGAVVQHELLVRLCRENGELMLPGEFLPVAERHGIITEIDRWVVEQGVALAAQGQPVEVNLSAASVGDDETLEVIRASLERTGADPSLLVFEVTETALMADVERGRQFADALHELGCRFALDDFGTGYGTFTYLKHLPIDHLKIDIEFVRDLVRDAEDERLVRVIVSVARALGKQTVAEGVEDAETLERLRELGVDHAQGFHIGRPVPLEQISAPVRSPGPASARVGRRNAA